MESTLADIYIILIMAARQEAGSAFVIAARQGPSGIFAITAEQEPSAIYVNLAQNKARIPSHTPGNDNARIDYAAQQSQSYAACSPI